MSYQGKILSEFNVAHPITLMFGVVLILTVLGFALAHQLLPASATDEAKALLIEIEPYGLEPREMDVEGDQYLVVVQNRSGLTDLKVKLEAEDGTKLHEDRAQQRQWRKRIDLQQGSYRLTVENFPQWTCLIRVK
jgi:hypothetical protein